MKASTWAVFGGAAAAVLLVASSAAATPHKLTAEEFGAGCSIPAFASWPDDVRLGFVWLGRVRYALDQIMGGSSRVTSGWRPAACNASRDGEDHSRHLRGWALDLALSRSQRDRLQAWLDSIGAFVGSTRARARAVGDAIRRLTGWRGFVGFRIYPSGSLHVDLGCPPGSTECDPRRADWFDDMRD